MKDFGIDKGLVQRHDLSKPGVKNSLFGFRKMFWDYLNKMGVPFFDECCPASATTGSPVRFNETTSKLQYLDKDTKVWTDVPSASLNPA